MHKAKGLTGKHLQFVLKLSSYPRMFLSKLNSYMLWMCLGEEDLTNSCVVQCLLWREQHGSLYDPDQNRERVRGGQGRNCDLFTAK